MSCKDCAKVVTRSIWMLAAVLVCTTAAHAQLEFGDNLKMSMNGDLGYGYSASNGNYRPSAHNNGFVGSGDLTGYYFHPNFLSFDVRPYFQRNQANQESQSVTRGTGISASVGLFGGSRFPGSISFGKDFSSNSEYRVAGIPTLSADSSGQSFGITWSAIIPELPNVTASYTIGSTDTSISGFNSDAKTASKNFYLTSGYYIAGFSLAGHYSHYNSNFKSAEILTGTPQSAETSGTSYGISAQHALPMRGSIGLGWGHGTSNSDTGANWTTNIYSATNTFMPWRRLTLFQNANYTDDMVGAYAQSVLNGAASASTLNDDKSTGVSYSAGASFDVGHGLTLGGHYTHRRLWSMGRTYMDTQYGGNANFNRSSRLFGLLYFGIGIVDTASKSGNDGLGVTANVGMNRRIGRWDTSADFIYSQATQTLYTIETTSNYSYGGSIRRRFNEDTSWGASVRLAQSGLVMREGDNNNSKSYSSFLGWKRYNVTGTYSQSSGTAVLNTSGELTPTPVGSLISDDFLLFDATSWSVGFSTRVIRRMVVSGGYSHFESSTSMLGTGRSDDGNRFSIRTEYRLRKFQIIGGYNRTEQTASIIPGGPRNVNYYYLSLSRWFNVF